MGLLAMLLVLSSAMATIRTVSPVAGAAQFTDIPTAYAVAQNGDTILIGPGNYVNVSVNCQKRLYWLGAGWDQVVWSHVGAIPLFFQSGANRSVVEGIKFDSPGSWGLYLYNPVDSITIRRCHVSCGFQAAVGYETGHLTIEDCVLISASNYDVFCAGSLTGPLVVRNSVLTFSVGVGAAALAGVNGGAVEVYNNVFVNVRTPFSYSGSAQVIGLNNLFYDWGASPGWGTLPAGSAFEYTASDNSGPGAFPANFANNINLGANNPFVNYSTANNYIFNSSDFTLNNLAGGLACTNTGYPSILDLDSTRSDIGIFGGPKPWVIYGIPAYPFALTLNIDPLVEVGDSVSVTSTGRIGPRY
jgi:hypothetical protein